MNEFYIQECEGQTVNCNLFWKSTVCHLNPTYLQGHINKFKLLKLENVIQTCYLALK